MAFDWIRNQNKLGEAPAKGSKPGSTQITRASVAPLPQGMAVRDGEYRTEISRDTVSPQSLMPGLAMDQTRNQMAEKLFSRRKSKKSSGKSESEHSYGQD